MATIATTAKTDYNNVQLTEEVKDFIRQNGYYVVHIRKIPTLPCPRCTYREPKPHCPVCLGTGYIVKAKPLLVRTQGPARPEFEQVKDTPLSLMGSERRLFYCLPDAVPIENDLLVEVTWTVPRDEVLKRGHVLYIHRVYDVEHIEPMHGFGGELYYYKIAVHDLDIDQSWLLTQLQRD